MGGKGDLKWSALCYTSIELKKHYEEGKDAIILLLRRSVFFLVGRSIDKQLEIQPFMVWLARRLYANVFFCDRAVCSAEESR